MFKKKINLTKRQKKEENLKKLSSLLDSSWRVLFFDFKNLKASEMDEFRLFLKKKFNLKFKIMVFKSKLIKLALQKLLFSNYQQTIKNSIGAIFFEENDNWENIFPIANFFQNKENKIQFLFAFDRKKLNLIGKTTVLELSVIPSKSFLVLKLRNLLLSIIQRFSFCLKALAEKK